ncbi:type VI secretion system tip protein VgrG [Pelagicoccus sp. SDUM812005]|uniref:type VI secretion system tip protein VgrG n=1 Tax=Pelagicoccus sp. SDUM812005 TaxID=3041257 RepID=UPI00280DCA5E|nr:type VI secretion system tip protein VgrG [Pelagicoccus sp. SDUM812005]MDQ8180555.1 type VI secretion system tip protein VgrG [Pelagicoccus sp. SDUM812005]
MPNPRIVPSAAPKDVVTATIKVDGNALSRTFEIAAVSVVKNIGRIPFARIELYDGDPATETFPACDSQELAPGGEIEIHAGYRSSESPIFKGILVSHSLRIRASGRPILTLVCRHPLYQSTLTRRSRSFQELTDSDAISEILGAYGVSIDANTSEVTHESLFQYHCTDWDFCLARAQANSLLLIPTDDGATLAPLDSSQTHILQLQYGATIYELDLELDIRTQATEVTASAWDPASQEALEATASEPELPTAGNQSATDLASLHGQSSHFHHAGAVSQEELDAFASGQLLLQRLGARVGRVRCIGTSDPVPGQLLDIAGISDRFSGSYLISGVRHTLSNGSWYTDLQVGLLPQEIQSSSHAIAAPAAAAMLPHANGLHIGIVEALEGDPQSEFRIQVKLPTQGEDAAPYWARLASIDAGDARGAFLYPEIGDEVVVAFFDHDPRHPVVLGSLYSSARPAPLEPSDDNHEKGFFSRSEMKLHFNDDLVSATLETPNGNILQLSEDEGGILLEDENGNKITLSSDGIELSSAADLVLTASGDVSIEGTNVTHKANAQFTAEGASAAELKASGNTTIKGALVQIN